MSNWSAHHSSRSGTQASLVTPLPSGKPESEMASLHYQQLSLKSRMPQSLPNDFVNSLYPRCVKKTATSLFEKSAFSWEKSSRLFPCHWLVYVSWPPSDHSGLPFLYCLGKGGVVLLCFWCGLFTLTSTSLGWFWWSVKKEKSSAFNQQTCVLNRKGPYHSPCWQDLLVIVVQQVNVSDCIVYL